MMNFDDKYFALVITYTTGKAVFLTNKATLEEALAEFRQVQEERFASNLKFKSFSLPSIISAEIIQVVK